MIIPKSIAPKLIRFAQTSNTFIKINANSNESGIVDATINPPRQFPNRKTNIKMTINAPSIKLVVTVLVVLAIKELLSKKGSIVTPSGSDFPISCIRFLTAVITLSEFAPFSIKIIPPTASPFPSLVNAPYLMASPKRTFATFLMVMGMPFWEVITMFSMSSMLLAKPSPRIKLA